jgi:hypothetical protein
LGVSTQAWGSQNLTSERHRTSTFAKHLRIRLDFTSAFPAELDFRLAILNDQMVGRLKYPLVNVYITMENQKV